MSKTKEEKALKGTLRKCRVTDNQMEGTIANINDVDKSVFYNDYAYEEWTRLFVELSELGVIQATDITGLIMICDSWGVYCEAKDNIRDGFVTTTPNGLEQNSLHFNNFRIAYRDYFNMIKDFGLTPLARQKISMGKQSDDDPIANLLK